MRSSVVFLLLAGCSIFADAALTKTSNRAITRVVKMLQAMIEKSEVDGDSDRVLFAKFKCYCDSQKRTKTKEIEDLSTDISLFQSKIEELQGATGTLSTECAELTAAMAENEASREEAAKIRKDQKDEFDAKETDLTNAIGQMKGAIETLSEVGADQSMASAADHAKFMGVKSASFLTMESKVKAALQVASTLMAPEQKKSVATLLQAPFTGTYSAQSGEVVGILKSMQDTFEKDLSDSMATEEDQKTQYRKFKTTMETAYSEMSSSYESKQGTLSDNDGELASKRGLLADAQSQLETKQNFISELLPMCEDKTKEYEERKALRANEDAAIAQAISILNSDAAFASFGKVSATSTGATGDFLQRSAIKLHEPDASKRARVLQLLKQTATSERSLRLAQVASLVQLGNPFATVLVEITKMLTVIEEEGKADDKKLNWCRDERREQNTNLDAKKLQITELTTAIGELTTMIEAPETGLLAMIAGFEASLAECSDNQKSATETRKEENAAYQSDVANLQEADALVSEATKVLASYYQELETHGDGGPSGNAPEDKVLSGESEAVMKTFEDEEGYRGQSTQGNAAIEMLEFILAETKKEEAQAHTDEQNAQKSYEDMITGLKESEATMQESLATSKSDLAAKEKEKAEKTKDLEETTADKLAIEDYLLSIKAGCDFMEDNFDKREAHRLAETNSLTEAQGLIKDTPAYKSAEAEAHTESLGDCKADCEESEEHVQCKACLAKVTVPAYCAGHAGTPGC